MKHLCTIYLLLLSILAKGQNIIIPSGDYMDTTAVRSPACAKAPYVHYYSVGGKYPRSSETLVKEARMFLQRRQQVYQGSGYITFRFVVDCAGHRQPRTQVLQTDNSYQRYRFRKELVAELYAFLATLTEWRAAKTPSGQAVNYQAYLTFKLKDGQVVAVIP